MADHAQRPPRRRRKEARPGEIISAALELFVEHGFAATRLEDVAERAGVAKGTIYVYFSTKEALFEAVVRDAFNPVLDRIRDAMAEPGASSTALLRFMIETIYREIVATERREIIRLLLSEARRFPDLVAFYHREAISRARAIAAEVLRRGVEQGEFQDNMASRFPEALFGPAILAAVWKLVFEDVEPMELDRMLAAHLDLVFSGIAAKPVGGAVQVRTLNEPLAID